MPLGRLLRLVDRVTGDNVFGNIAGSIGRGIQRRSNRRDAAVSSAVVPPGPPQPGVVQPAGNVQGPDVFDQTGQAVGTVAGGIAGSAFGPGGAAIGAVAGSQLGRAVGSQVTVPFQGGGNQQSNPNALALLSQFGGSGRGGRRAALEALLATGALNGIMRAPIIFTAPDGRVRYGSDTGFVLIRRMSGGRKQIFQMPKMIARDLGLWKPRKKPIISVRDSNAIRRARTATNRLERVAKDAGLCVSKRKGSCSPTRRRSTTTRRRTTRRRSTRS